MNKPRRILLATDLSDQAGPLIAHALPLARAFEARLHTVHVRSPVPVPGDLMKHQQQEAAVERDTKARKRTDALVRKHGATGVDVVPVEGKPIRP